MADPGRLLVSIVIITRHRAHLLEDCLRHVLAQDYAPFEIIVVDASEHDATQCLMANYPQARYVRLRDAAQQMPRSRNEGIKLTRGEFIAFIDDDSQVQPGWLRALVGAYTDSRVGGVGGMVLAPNETPTRGGMVGAFSSTGTLLGNFNVLTENAQPVDHLRGCNMSFRRRALQAIGGFDPLYDGSNVREETDVCAAIRRQGWRLYYEPRARVIHLYAAKETFSRDDRADRASRFSIAKNSTYFRLKHFYSLKTLGAIFVGGPVRACVDSVRRLGWRGIFTAWSDWTGRLAGAYTFVKSGSRGRRVR